MCVQWLLSAAILAQWRHSVASTKDLDLLYQAMRAVSYRHNATAIKMARKVGPFFCCLFCLLLAWWLLGQYGASSCPMAASSDFQSSPGHAASGNAICIAPVHCHGHQNGQQWRNILMPLLILSSTITVLKSMSWSVTTNADL
jgi:hypothetical protein